MLLLPIKYPMSIFSSIIPYGIVITFVTILKCIKHKLQYLYLITFCQINQSKYQIIL